MTPPIEGMKTRPYGEDYMVGAWMSLVVSALDEGPALEFKAETGHDIRDVLDARGLTAAIDEATGHKRDVIVAWCDWVTTNLWGAESSWICAPAATRRPRSPDPLSRPSRRGTKGET